MAGRAFSVLSLIPLSDPWGSTGTTERINVRFYNVYWPLWLQQ